jgi:DNA-binding MarR family transcriptional regulator
MPASDTTELDDLLADDRVTLWGLFLEAGHAIDRRLRADLDEAVHLPEGWFEVLLRIGRSPGRAVPMTRLARMVLFSSGGFTKLADRMEAAGLIRREPCPSDRRSLLATLTPKGEAVLHRGLAAHVPSLERHFAGLLDDAERADLERVLRTLRDPYCAEVEASEEG